MGCLYKRKHSKFWWIKYHQNGRPMRESTGTTKETVARRMLRTREGDVERGIPIMPKAGRVTFDEAATDLLNDYRINGKRSLAHAERRIEKHLKPAFRGKRLGSVSTPEIRTFIASRQQAGASNATINRELALLKRMFSIAVKDAKLYNRPHIPMLKESNVRTGFFEREQFESVRAHLPTPLQPVATFLYLTGWRKSEVLSLQWRNVDLDAGVVRLDVGATKNDRGRVLPYGDALPEMVDLLNAQRDITRTVERERNVIVPWVFHRSGKPIRSFYKAWHSACERAGCPGRVPHDFRRTATRNLTRRGAPERVAMEITGHKTRSVFDRYDIVNEADIASGLRRLAGSVSGTVAGTLSGTGQRFRRVAAR